MGRPVIDLTGQKINELTVIKQIGVRKDHALWLCKCSCGNHTEVTSSKLRDTFRNTKSCGCLSAEANEKRFKTHGYTHAGTKQISEYNAWASMKDRCLRAKHPHFFNYGGRGISVCERWINSFENFITDMGFKPTSKHTLDRIDVNGNYEPSNCRWALWDMQNKNKRTNRWVECRGKRLILTDWARLLNIFPTNLGDMLKRKSMEQIIKYYEERGNSIVL